MAVKGKGEIEFATSEEEYAYRMKDTPIDLKKLACARISRALEDVFDPPLSVTLYDREESLKFLTGDSQYYTETRDFWCDLSGEYEGAKLKELCDKRYKLFDNKIPSDLLSEAERKELQRSLVEYSKVCEEIRTEFSSWLRGRCTVKKEYDDKFAHSLLCLPFKYPYSDDLNNLMTLKKEYDTFFVESKVPYKIDLIPIKINEEMRTIQKIYNKGEYNG